MGMRDDIIKVAQTNPETRRYLVPLLREAAVDKEAIEFDTPKALRRYLQQHPNADKSKHTVKKQDDSPPKAEDLKGQLTHFFAKVKGAAKDVVDAVKAAPQTVQQLFVDPKHREKFFGGMAHKIDQAPKDVVKKIFHAAGKEIHEIKHAVKAAKKLFKKPPPGPFSKEDKRALYSAGAYVVGAMLAAIPPAGTAIAAAGVLGHSFAMHVGLKAVHGLLDTGFLHYEWAHEVFHVVTHISADKNEDEELTEGLVRVISDVMKNLTDEDMEKILAGGEKPDDDED